MEKSKSLSRDRLTGIILFFILTALSVSGTFFHEPWFDEIQAYLIARDASFHDIFFVLPHYEGHPPLWHILLLPAKLGLSCRAALNLAQIVTFAGFAAMLELRSPFGWKMKIFLSLNYYILYQYSVISRPYAMLMLAGLLVADVYPDRDKKPFRYLLAMLFICLCHSYGIAVAGGLAAADLLHRILKEKSISGVLKNTNKKLIASYCLLLAGAVIIIADIFPQGNANGIRLLHFNKVILAFIMCWTLLPSETVFTSYINDDTWLQTLDPGLTDLIVGGFFSALIWYILISICKKRKIISELLIPYIFLTFFLSMYAMPHHFGIFITFSIMILWIAQKTEPITIEELKAPLEKSQSLKKCSRYIVGAFFGIAAAVNIYWSVYSYSIDIKNPYDAGENAAQWIKDNDLEDKKIFSAWNEDTTRMLTYGSTSVNGFMEKNIFINADQGASYSTHVMTTDEEYASDIEWMRSLGSPDVILTSSVSIAEETKQLGLEDKYTLCYLKRGQRVFKDKIITVYTVIYVRSDLADGIKKDIE